MKTVDAKKITSKLMVGDTKKAEYGELYRVIGSAISVKTGVSGFGEWTALLGQFQAWTDDKKVNANTLFLPEVATIPIALALKKGETVDFGLIISKVEADNAFGFEYLVQSIIPQKESTQLDDLRKKFDAYAKGVKPKELPPEPASDVPF